MQRRVFSREFKLEAVRLVTERGVAVVHAARDLDVAESVLRRWMRDAAGDARHAFPGHGQVRPEQQEIDRLRREVAKLRAERDILKRPRRISPGMRYEVRLCRGASFYLAGGLAVLSAGRLALGLSRLAEPAAKPSCCGG